MSMQIVAEPVEAYLAGLLTRYDEPVLVEMEAEAKEKGFPIVGRHVGVTLELLAGLARAERVFELGSGYGYSAYWFARGTGPGGEVHCSDGDAENAKKAEAYLGRAGLWNRIRFHTGDAVSALNATGGDFDIVYNDIDKHGYPDAWLAARGRVRPGGLYICDNVLWSGRVAETPVTDDVREGWTAAIVEHNRLIATDPGWQSTILPIRDGVLVARRIG